MNSKLPRLILHFDVNGTIIITDPKAGLSFDDALEKAVAQSDWDGSATYPPSTLCNKTNVSKADMIKALTWPNDVDDVPELCRDGKHHFVFPSFFNTINELAKAKREFSIVIRTFGSDIQKVKEAVNAYAMGKHPQYGYSGSEELILPPSRVWIGRYGGGRFPPDGTQPFPKTQNGEVNYTLQNVDDPTKLLNQDEQIINALDCRFQPRSVVACTDHYEWWKAHAYMPSSGKPMWLTKDDHTSHHIFFDDCIHKSTTDSIVSVRMRKTANSQFKFLSGADTAALQGCHTVRVQTADAIVNPNYFLDKIRECEMARKD